MAPKPKRRAPRGEKLRRLCPLAAAYARAVRDPFGASAADRDAHLPLMRSGFPCLGRNVVNYASSDVVFQTGTAECMVYSAPGGVTVTGPSGTTDNNSGTHRLTFANGVQPMGSNITFVGGPTAELSAAHAVIQASNFSPGGTLDHFWQSTPPLTSVAHEPTTGNLVNSASSNQEETLMSSKLNWSAMRVTCTSPLTDRNGYVESFQLVELGIENAGSNPQGLLTSTRRGPYWREGWFGEHSEFTSIYVPICDDIAELPLCGGTSQARSVALFKHVLRINALPGTKFRIEQIDSYTYVGTGLSGVSVPKLQTQDTVALSNALIVHGPQLNPRRQGELGIDLQTAITALKAGVEVVKAIGY